MLKGIKQPTLTTKTTKLPGTELPTVRHSSDITGNKDIGNVVKNMTSAFKNPLMGQKSVMTNTKNHNFNQVKTSLPSIKTGFEPVKIHEGTNQMDLRKVLILETTILRNKIDHGVHNGLRTHSGSKDSAINRTALKRATDAEKPQKLDKKESWGIQNMSQKKKNQGLNYLSKLDTQKRKEGVSMDTNGIIP